MPSSPPPPRTEEAVDRLWGQAGAQEEAPHLSLILGSEPGRLGQAEPCNSSRGVQMFTAGESVY